MTDGAARVLDPVSRASEILFGLIMVLTFTAALNTAEASRSDVRLMLIGALGCNLAWGLIDAAMYLLSARAERALTEHMIRTVRTASPEIARREIASNLPPSAAKALSEAEFERIRQFILSQPARVPRTGPEPADLRAAALVFVLVFVATLPVTMPFALIDDPHRALWLSHAIAIASLFLTGFTLGRHWGQPWRVGLAMVALGLILVSVALALGG